MICNDNIPSKEDTTVEATTTTVTATTTTTTEPECVATSSTSTNPTTANRFFNIQFQQKTRQIREMWIAQRGRINKNYSQFILIILLCFLAIISCIASLTTSNWTCNASANQYYGIWNSCWWEPKQEVFSITENNNTTMASNDTIIPQKMMCAKQVFDIIETSWAEQWRLDQIYASQGLIISGIVMYIISVVCIFLGYKFIRMNNMNYLRNTLITSVFVQIIAFLLLLIGFFLFIFTDKFSTSIILLFVYFALAIFATNIINFITIEYKCYKIRQI